MIIGVDIDGVVVDIKATLAKLGSSKTSLHECDIEWLMDNYYSYTKPIFNKDITWLKVLSTLPNHKIMFITGRPEMFREEVKTLLADLHIDYSELVMSQMPINKILKSGFNDKLKAHVINTSGVDIYIEDDYNIAKQCDIPILLFGQTDKVYCKTVLPVPDWKTVFKLLCQYHMFAPGPIMSSINLELDFSHRDDKFSTIMEDVKKKLKESYNISNAYEILFTNGSATSANETVISSLMSRKRVLVLSNGTFGDRLQQMANFYTDDVYYHRTEGDFDPIQLEEVFIKFKPDWVVMPHFETSMSQVNNIEPIQQLCKMFKCKLMIDAVSSFGYLTVPSIDCIITSSSKILGGVPVLGIIIIRKELLEDKIEEHSFYLNLKRVYTFARKNQTPSTSLVPQYVSLRDSLDSMSAQKRKKSIFKNITAFNVQYKAGLERVGDVNSHVLTFKLGGIDTEVFKKELEKYNIRVYINSHYMDSVFQISCFSTTEIVKYRYLATVLNSIIPKLGGGDNGSQRLI